MTFEELEQIATETRENREKSPCELNVCVAAGCLSLHSDAVKKSLEEEVKRTGATCRVRGTGCMGLCSLGPLVTSEPSGQLYKSVAPADATEIVAHLEGAPVARLLCSREQPFFQRQNLIVLENSGRIDPEKIEEYIAADGYRALVHALTEMNANEIVQEISKSGLRGRGGAGYPTGLKWGTVAKTAGTTKYVICNADEGDPGAFMDRSVLESDPHRVLEGMAIAAYAVGATRGYIYVRAEYPLAVKRFGAAIREARRLGFLGSQICNTKFNFDMEVRIGGGAFVCGEETALIASIEGRRGSPRPRPPYPAQAGLWDMPTLINNVETFAMGTTLRQIIYEIGGGVPEGHKFKAVQTGGPSGGCIPEQFLDLSVDYESLRELGSIMGSGGMIVMDDSACMVNVARYFMEFCMSESCGKCIPCRSGTAQMYELLTRMTVGTATAHDLDLLEELCDMVSGASLCGLGQSAPNPVLSTLRYFRDEYSEHINEKRCRAGVCECGSAVGVTA